LGKSPVSRYQHLLFRRWLIHLTLVLGIFACNMPSLALERPPSQETLTLAPLQTPTQPGITPTAPVTSSSTPTATTSRALPISPPAPSYQPVFEPSPCDFPVPPGFQPDCGYLVVPENRSKPGSRFIRLHVAIFHSQSANPAPDSVIHLAGVPGSSSRRGHLLHRVGCRPGAARS
jgi:hypothetical protein